MTNATTKRAHIVASRGLFVEKESMNSSAGYMWSKYTIFGVAFGFKSVLWLRVSYCDWCKSPSWLVLPMKIILLRQNQSNQLVVSRLCCYSHRLNFTTFDSKSKKGWLQTMSVLFVQPFFWIITFQDKMNPTHIIWKHVILTCEMSMLIRWYDDT